MELFPKHYPSHSPTLLIIPSFLIPSIEEIGLDRTLNPEYLKNGLSTEQWVEWHQLQGLVGGLEQLTALIPEGYLEYLNTKPVVLQPNIMTSLKARGIEACDTKVAPLKLVHYQGTDSATNSRYALLCLEPLDLSDLKALYLDISEELLKAVAFNVYASLNRSFIFKAAADAA